MAQVVIMPRQGQSVESCIIAKWHKQPGDEVKTGDILFTYETDKATFEEEAKADGTMLAVFFEEGDDVPCLTNVCVIGAEGEDVSEFAPKEDVGEEASQTPVAEVPAEEKPAAVIVNTEKNSGAISPRAKLQAEHSGVDIRFIEGTGPHGRVIERDVINAKANGMTVTRSAAETYLSGSSVVEGTGIGGRVRTGDLAAQPSATAPCISGPDYVEEPLPNIRKVIAKTMMQSLGGMAQLTLNASFDATEMMAYRKRVKQYSEKNEIANITLNDIVLYATVKTLLHHRAVNANLVDDTLRYFNTVNLGVAVDTPRGLMVPTVFHAETKTLSQVSDEVKDLAAQCKEGTISPDLLKNGSFTVTNLGSFGIESFTPVINPPQTCILGVNTITNKVREGKNGMEVYPSMALSLTFDHRALDGAPAARFLQELCFNLEHFSILLAQ